MIVLSSLALLKGKKALVPGIANDQSIAVRRCVWIGWGGREKCTLELGIDRRSEGGASEIQTFSK